MITITVNVPNPSLAIGAGYTTLSLQKSGNQTSTGTYADVSGASITLAAGTTSYALSDFLGGYGDWYQPAYKNGIGGIVPASNPQPGYLPDLMATARDLLGITTNEASDAQIQGIGFFPEALSRCRQRLATFDALVLAGGDFGNACLAALAHLTAALLCTRMTVQVMDAEQFDRYRYQRNRQLDWNAARDNLMQQFEILISLAAGEVASNAGVYVPATLLAGPVRSGNEQSGLVPFNPDPQEVNPLLAYPGDVTFLNG